MLRPAPTNYLSGLSAAAAAAAAGGTDTLPGNAAEEQRQQVLQDGREVAAELAAHPGDPTRSCLHLRVLAPARTLAAIAGKLTAGQRAAQAKASLLLRMHAAEQQRVERVRLLSFQRALQLAGVRNRPQPLVNAVRGGQLQQLQQQQEERRPQVAKRRQLNAAVLGSHKEMKKAWREKRCAG